MFLDLFFLDVKKHGYKRRLFLLARCFVYGGLVSMIILTYISGGMEDIAHVFAIPLIALLLMDIFRKNIRRFVVESYKKNKTVDYTKRR